jgi:oligopeptide transport system substrate-binding protein
MDRVALALHLWPLSAGLRLRSRSSAVQAVAAWHSDVAAPRGERTRLLLGIVIAAIMSAPLSGHGASWADPGKTLRVAMEIDVTGFDPAATQDLYSNTIETRILDALYVWDYLGRPYRLVPSVAAAMPDISADGRVWTIRIKPGIYFAADEC